MALVVNATLKRNSKNNIILVPLALTTGELDTDESASDMTITYQKNTDTVETSVTAVAMTEGTYTASGWVEAGSEGYYQFGVPDAAVQGGGETQRVIFRCEGDDSASAPTFVVCELVRSVAR